MKKTPRVYCASIATETNTFSPLKTNLKNFKETFYAEPYKHPKTPRDIQKPWSNRDVRSRTATDTSQLPKSS